MVKRCGNVGLLAILLAFAAMATAQGIIDADAFDTPAQEQRYRALTEEFRCPKCLNTNLAGSDSPIAADLRATIHRLIIGGKSDAEIRTYLHDRYGDFVLYDPPLRLGTALLWFAPAVLIVIGFIVLGVMVSRRRGASVPLSDAEQQRLSQLLREEPSRDAQ